MNIHLITFAGTDDPYSKEDRHYIVHGIHRDYTGEAKRFLGSAIKIGIHGSTLYDLDWLKSTKEYAENPKVLSKPPYAWAFKPLSIWYALNKASNGDVVLYADTNYVFYKFPQRIIDTAVINNIYTYDHSPTYYPNYMWTHRDTFISMGCDEKKYWNGPQYHADVIGVYKNDFTMKFVEEWKDYTCDYDTIIGNVYDNHPDFVDNRYDQSVFSILAVKYNIAPQLNPYDMMVEAETMIL